ncbi:RcnB family protein [Caenimonas terrae]|uniref:RcnB family protein n=1 Tax=Caenimonas terrae TaxID=696074 RepID=A0ABW0NG72_9BURK
MNSRFVLPLAAAALCAASLPALAQGRVYDRNASNNPEIYQQTHPEDRSNPQLQGPPAAAPQPPARGADRPDRGQRPAPPADQPRDAHRRDPDRRQGDHRRNERRDYGYVVPRPYYYSVPAPVYYGPPAVYYGAVPQPYYSYPVAPSFQVGDYLPPEYRDQQFVIQDWQWRGLPPPPYGFHWLMVGADGYALVADATGQIISLVAAR